MFHPGSWVLTMETVLLVVALFGLFVSLVLTTDSIHRYLRIRPLLDQHNAFPRMHLRNDISMLLLQILWAIVSVMIHNYGRTPEVSAAIAIVWPVFVLRFIMIVVLTGTQVWNWVDRHRMHYGVRGGEALPPVPAAK